MTRLTLLCLALLCTSCAGYPDTLIVKEEDDAATVTGKVVTRLLLGPLTLGASESEIALHQWEAKQRQDAPPAGGSDPTAQAVDRLTGTVLLFGLLGLAAPMPSPPAYLPPPTPVRPPQALAPFRPFRRWDPRIPPGQCWQNLGGWQCAPGAYPVQ